MLNLFFIYKVFNNLVLNNFDFYNFVLFFSALFLTNCGKTLLNTKKEKSGSPPIYIEGNIIND
jgi:hypothetical protein